MMNKYPGFNAGKKLFITKALNFKTTNGAFMMEILIMDSKAQMVSGIIFYS